ncbi:MAG: phosphoribosylanthranilate isomerase [Candidatus Tectimicrobiota bacterium]|nr:MAG: phosphoribosylanthranilate isomerase [Candidatus Tectomicrobia bacterium]
MQRFDSLGRKKVVIGLVHLPPLPGTPFYREGSLAQILEGAVADALALYRGGADGCLVQTVDRVYAAVDDADAARVAAVAVITRAIVEATGPEFAVGVQIMLNALKASLAVAKVCGGAFLRCTALVGATLTAAGLVQANPLDVLTYRACLGAEEIKLIAEVHSVHFRWLGGERSVAEVARMAVRAGADAVEVAHPDEATNARLVREVKEALPQVPVLLGGYTTHENVARRLAEADGVFVGTCLKAGPGEARVDVDRVRAYVDLVSRLQ